MTGHLHRYRDIASTLTRNGLYAIALKSGLGRWIPADTPSDDDRFSPELLVAAFEELGTTFVKLGQLISTRPDIFPESYCDAFGKLTDDTEPVPFEDIMQVIEEEFSSSVDELYEWFDREPVATASIGQVHRARLHDGRDVVVKVRKPGVAKEVQIDLEILRTLSGRITRSSEELSDMDFEALVDQFASALHRELDYLAEARACEEIRENFEQDGDVRVPWVDWDTTTSRVLTMEELSGARIDNTDALDTAGIDRPALAARSAEIVLKMVFEDGIFHADPHAGNLFVEADGTIGIIDYGSVGRLSPDMRRKFARMMMAFIDQDDDRLVSALVEIAPPRGTLDRRRLRTDVSRITVRFEGGTLGNIEMDQIVGQIFTIVRRYRLSLPPEIVQLFRMLMIADGLGRKIDPDFDIGAALTPYAETLIEDQLNPKWVAQRLRSAAIAAAELGADLPGYVRTVMEQIETGGVDINIRASELDPLVARLERTGDRMVAALIIAAMITGGTNILSSYKDQLGRFIGPVVAAGGAALTGGSAYLAWSSRPRRKHRP